MRNIQNLGNIMSMGNISQGTYLQYLLKDTFATNLAAGAVNGTNADIGGVRTVTDTNSKISISSGKLTFATGEAANDGVWYPSLTRVAGRLLIALINGDSGMNVGWDSNGSGALLDGFRFSSSGAALGALRNGSSVTVGTYTINTDYQVCAIQKATGCYYFVKGGTEFPKWTLVWVDIASTNTPLLPVVNTSITTGVYTVDNFRVPVATYLPTPLCYDTFTRSNGAIGSTESTGPDSQSLTPLVWSGSTWTIASNVAVNTPVTMGSEILTDPGIEAWTSVTNATSWTESVNGTSTVNQETSVVHGGSNAVRLDIDVGADIASLSQIPTAVVGLWYKVTLWGKASAGGSNLRLDFPGGGSQGFTTTTSYQQFGAIFRATATNPTISIRNVTGAGNVSLYADDVSVKPFTTSELFASISTSTKDVIADVNLTLPTTLTAPAGLVLNLDSTSNPQNFVVAYVDIAGSRVASLVKCVAGVYTSVISASITYSAGATLRVIKDGTSYQLFYNNAKVGSTSTISDAGVIGNTLHGLFSTDSGNSLDNFLVMPRGSTNNEYSALDSY